MRKYVFGTEYYGIYITIIEQSLDRALNTAKKEFPKLKNLTNISIDELEGSLDEDLKQLILKQNNG